MFAESVKSVGRFLRDAGGATGLMAAAAAPVLVVMVGVGIDYARAQTVKSRIQHAVDAAALAVSNSQLLIEAGRVDQIRPFIRSNLGDLEGVAIDRITVDQNNDGFVQLDVEARIENAFSDLLGMEEFPVNVSATVEFSRTRDLDIAILLDNSPSMLIGASETDIDNMEADFSCAFACHYPDHWGNTYDLARDRGYDTRLDAAKDSILRTFDLAENSGYAEHAEIYFDVNVFARDTVAVAQGLVSAALRSSVGGIEPEPRPSGGDIYTMTDPETAMNTMQARMAEKVAAFSDRQHFLLIVTDGVTDYRRGGRHIHEFRSEYCNAVKALGVRIGVIYTTYFPIPSNGFWRSNVDPIDENIEPNLRACASPGWFFEAQYGDDIDLAFQKLLEIAIPSPQLTR